MEEILSNPWSFIGQMVPFIFLGVVGCYIFWYEYKSYSLKKNGEKVKATLTKVKIIKRAGNRSYARIYYVFRTYRGESFKGKDMLVTQSLFRSLSDGQEIDVLYDRVNPKKNIPTLLLSDTLQSLGMRVVFIVFLLLMVFDL